MNKRHADWWNKAAQKGWLRRVTEPSSDNDDDAMMRVISVCFSNVFSFLWLNHLISGIMTDKKSVVSTPALPDLGPGWSLVTENSPWMEMTEMMVGTMLMSRSRLTRLSEMTGDGMGKQSEPTFPLRWANTRQDTWYTRDKLHPRGKGLVSEHAGDDGNISFPCVSEVLLCYAICVTPCHAFDWFSFPRPGIIVENVGRPRKLN